MSIEEFEPANEFGVKFLKGLKLQDFQVEIIKWVKMRESQEVHGIRGSLGAVDLGTGKTIVSLTMIMSDYAANDVPKMPTLVVCPNRAIFTWKGEIAKFFGKSIKYLLFRRDVLGADAVKSISVCDLQKYHIILTNYEQIRGESCPLFAAKFRRIVFDESHCYNNPKSVVFNNMMKLKGDSKLALSGTPIRNHSVDLYAQFRVLGFNKIVSPKQFNAELYEQYKLADFVIYMTKEDAGIRLPEAKTNKVVMTLEGREKQLYDFMFNELRKEYNLIGSANINVLSLFMRLRQFCSVPYSLYSLQDDIKEHLRDCHVNDLDIDKGELALYNSTKGMLDWLTDVNGTAGKEFIKMSATMNIVRTKIPEGDKIIIYSNFKATLRILQKMLSDAGISILLVDGDVKEGRDELFTLFKTSDKVRVLLMTYKLGSESLNLTEANHMILMDPVWCPVVSQQAKCRIHRFGQKKNVFIWEFCIKDTIEEKMVELCSKKTALIKDFIEKDKNGATIVSSILNSMQ